MSHIRTGFLPAPGFDPIDALDTAATVGLDYVEIYAEGPDWRDGILGRPQQFRTQLDSRDLGVHAHLPFPIDLGSPFKEIQDGAVSTIERYISDVADLGAEKAVLHLSAPSHYAANQSLADRRPVLRERAQQVTSIGEAYDVEVCAENLPSSAFSIDEFATLLDDTDISMTLDTGHAILSGWDEQEIATFITDYDDRISHVHLNDNRATTEGWRDEDEHLPFGAGSIDFAQILRPAIEDDWTPTLTMEIVTWDDEYIQLSVTRLNELLHRQK